MMLYSVLFSGVCTAEEQSLLQDWADHLTLSAFETPWIFTWLCFGCHNLVFQPTDCVLQISRCLHPTWMLSPISLASSFFNKTFLDSLIHFCTGGLDWLWVNTSLTLLSVFLLGFLLWMSSLGLFCACPIFFLIRVSG